MSKEDFRDLVTEAMVRKGFQTKKEFANRADRDASWVSRITTGSFKETPSPEDLGVLRDLLGIPHASLLAALGYDIGDTSEDVEITDYRLIELSREWPHLTPEEHGWILDIMNSSKRRREVRTRALAAAEEADAGYSVRQG